MYEQRFYRAWSEKRPLCRHELKIEESDLLILFDNETGAAALKTAAETNLRSARTAIKKHIHETPYFAHALSPIDISPSAPPIIRAMGDAGRAWNVGPMAAVAGAVAESVARAICRYSETVLVENGGDIFAISPTPVRFALYAGETSPFRNALTFEVSAKKGIAICTSSGRIGPSLSMGSADAVAAIHRSGAVADAAATSIANRIRTSADITAVTEEEQRRKRLHALIACMDDKLGIWGDITLIKN